MKLLARFVTKWDKDGAEGRFYYTVGKAIYQVNWRIDEVAGSWEWGQWGAPKEILGNNVMRMDELLGQWINDFGVK